eukprot:1070183-Alexandrium_andersonii.AAC.1
MPLTIPGEGTTGYVGGELLSLEAINASTLESARQRSIVQQHMHLNRGPTEQANWTPSSSSSRWQQAPMGSQEPHVWVGGLDRRTLTSIVVKGLTELTKQLGFESKMRGTPYGTQPSAPGGCIPFGCSEDVNEFVAKFKA